jgi:ATP-binding cassette subfamily B protein
VGLTLAIVLNKGAATTAAIFLTFNYFANITMILWEFNRIYRELENSIADAAQFTQLLLTPNQLKEVANPTALRVTRGEVEFRHIDFNYKGDQKQLLFSDLNLRIQPGEKVALVGRSGGGKTTATKLLLRFVDVTNGELLIDGQNIAAVSLKDLRSSIAYVPQEPAMFHRSIRENIRYGRLDASDSEVVEAAKKAHALEFIERLPNGFETLVGERGVKLSGGQRQRIAIARAIIKDAPILVLDEATSALDSESEKLIQAALWELMKERTAIVIAHRLSTIQKMDRIIVLDRGKIAEQGTHKQLLDHKGIYAKLWAHQSGGFIEE